MNAFCPFSVPQIEFRVDLSPKGDWEGELEDKRKQQLLSDILLLKVLGKMHQNINFMFCLKN